LTVHLARMWEMRNAHDILVEIPDVMKRLRGPRVRWQDNVIENDRFSSLMTDSSRGTLSIL